MTPYTPSSTGPFVGSVNLVDTTDLVQGGPSGTHNVPFKTLADNQAYLYAIASGFEGISSVSKARGSDGVLLASAPSAYERKVIEVELTGSSSSQTRLQMPNTGWRTGSVITIVKAQSGVAYDNFILYGYAGGARFIDIYGNLLNSLYLYDGESVTFYYDGAYYRLIGYTGGHFTAGDQCYGYKVKPMTLIRNGQEVNRKDFPRLWAFVNGSNFIVSDADWQDSTNNYQNRGFFSTGDGTTTFRLPDDMGTFDRAYTNGAPTQSGIAVVRDPSRYGNPNSPYDLKPGNLQVDGVGSHNHNYDKASLTSVGGGTATLEPRSSPTGFNLTQTATASADYVGPGETRPINVAKIPLIYY